MSVLVASMQYDVRFSFHVVIPILLVGVEWRLVNSYYVHHQ